MQLVSSLRDRSAQARAANRSAAATIARAGHKPAPVKRESKMSDGSGKDPADCEREHADPTHQGHAFSQAFTWPETSFVISNIVTLFLPLNTTFNASSALI